MKKSHQLLLICFGISIAVLSCSSPEEKKLMTSGPEVVPFAVLPFSLTEVKLLDGPFLHATELGIKTLLNYEPDRLMAEEISRGKSKITVRFRAHPGNMAGPVFGVRTIKR